MNRKLFFMLLLALAVIGGAGLVLVHRNQKTWSAREAKEGDHVLPDFPLNEVAQIHIQGGGNDFTVARINDLWCVRERANYPANFIQIKDLLLKLKDLNVVQSDLIGPSQFARLDLAAPGSQPHSATLLEFKNAHGQILTSLLVGKKHDRPRNDAEPLGLHGLFDGRYLLLPSDPRNALLVSDDLASVIPEPGFWLSPDFFKIENIKFISLTAPNAGDSWEMSRESDTAPWVLANPNPGELLNARMASMVAEILAFPKFNDVRPKTANLEASLGLDQPILVTALTDGLSYTLKIGRREPDGNYPMTVELAANLPTQRPASPDEKPEEKARLDAEFQAKIKDLQVRLAQGQALEPWVYAVGPWIEKVIRTRSELTQQPLAAGNRPTSP